ncbi:subtilisin-like protein [Thozetella sp. PMI_491]|nr:subtilisin-like protein [Thozetella sp. PMI_491]
MSDDDDDACYMLASWATPFTRAILEICRKKEKPLPKEALRKAGEIATRLHIVRPYIDSLPRYWIEPHLEYLCREMLKSLWPERLNILPGFVVKECNRRLVHLSDEKGRHSMNLSIYAFFSDPRNKEGIDDFYQGCLKLYEQLAPTSAEERAGPPSSIGNIAQHDYAHNNLALFEVLQEHCQCHPNFHGMPSGATTWHPTRLCLEGNPANPSFNILVSSMDMSFWQEFCLSVPPQKSSTAVESDILATGRFCTFLEEQLFTRLSFILEPGIGLYHVPESHRQELIPAAGSGEPLASILRHYRLTPRDRIMLSYAIAQAYWQFYDSELMRTKWTSQTIWFMPASNDISLGDQLPLQAFVSFPFGVLNDPPEDSIQNPDIYLNHRCPRIFALGVLLLEIGIANPFPTRPFQNPVSQANFDHKIATNQLERLRQIKWPGFSHMRYFIDAVEYCIEGSNFIQDPSDQNSTPQNSRRSEPHDVQKGYAERRKNLYNRVVRPLAWLAEKGFRKSATGVTYIHRIADPTPLSRVRSVPQDAPQEGEFCSIQSAPPSRWLENLKGISEYVDRKRNEHGIVTGVRVAILDTGINTTLPFYLDEDDGHSRLKRVACWRDFVNPDNASNKMDDFGHGTFMARLVAECAPFAEIMVARIAKNTKDLAKCQNNIAEAILWAGQEGADIISMSFGLPRDHNGIAEAIQKVTAREGGAVFFASAGNSADEEECFPARHPAVISVYATNRYGTFVESNSRRPDNGAHVFGTFSEDIPIYIQQEFEEEYRGVCKPGSSVATAVAAGIGAIMLAHAAVLPRLVQERPSDETLRALQRIRDSKGMEAVFRAMAQDMSGGRWFVNPVRFWKAKSMDEARYHALSACLWDVHRGL